MREKLKPVFDFENLTGLGPERRVEAMSIDAVMAALDGETALIQSAALLWHDHLDESHQFSQDIPNADGSFLHGIMHRREPDYSNAKYWFNRVGPHPAYPEILKRVTPLVAETSLEHLAGTEWDADGMVDAVCGARTGSVEYAILQQVQRVEFEVLLERFGT
ncbi:MAG: hypothetical protein H8E27_15565 [Verrucomicrobia subdivision 3 bacterium]|nr:hypothetical protein [Limisphaerales bacterium]